MDLVYGKTATLEKFRVLEVIARVPYQAWEHVSYIAMTHTARERGFARRVFERVRLNRRQQDNEQWHLLILEELTSSTTRRGWLKHRLLPQFIAFGYYHVSWLLYSLRPDWSYRLNADFEDHAEHEYAQFVAAHPELEDVPYDGEFAEEYGRFASRADLLRQISFDERMHKEESVALMKSARFR
jgi:ubiquinol oxidase